MRRPCSKVGDRPTSTTRCSLWAPCGSGTSTWPTSRWPSGRASCTSCWSGSGTRSSSPSSRRPTGTASGCSTCASCRRQPGPDPHPLRGLQAQGGGGRGAAPSSRTPPPRATSSSTGRRSGADQNEALQAQGRHAGRAEHVILSDASQGQRRVIVDPMNFARSLSMRDRQALLAELVERQPSIDLIVTSTAWSVERSRRSPCLGGPLSALTSRSSISTTTASPSTTPDGASVRYDNVGPAARYWLALIKWKRERQRCLRYRRPDKLTAAGAQIDSPGLDRCRRTVDGDQPAMPTARR